MEFFKKHIEQDIHDSNWCEQIIDHVRREIATHCSITWYNLPLPNTNNKTGYFCVSVALMKMNLDTSSP